MMRSIIMVLLFTSVVQAQLRNAPTPCPVYINGVLVPSPEPSELDEVEEDEEVEITANPEDMTATGGDEQAALELEASRLERENTKLAGVTSDELDSTTAKQKAEEDMAEAEKAQAAKAEASSEKKPSCCQGKDSKTSQHDVNMALLQAMWPAFGGLAVTAGFFFAGVYFGQKTDDDPETDSGSDGGSAPSPSPAPAPAPGDGASVSGDGDGPSAVTASVPGDDASVSAPAPGPTAGPSTVSSAIRGGVWSPIHHARQPILSRPMFPQHRQLFQHSYSSPRGSAFLPRLSSETNIISMQLTAVLVGLLVGGGVALGVLRFRRRGSQSSRT